MLALIKKSFDQYFLNWEIVLPEGNLTNRLAGNILKAGWTIRYNFGMEHGREYLEFYAVHRMTDDRHSKIYDDGEIVDLDAISSMILYNPKIPGDEEQQSRINCERNKRIYKELQDKGLDIMSINTYLSLNE